MDSHLHRRLQQSEARLDKLMHNPAPTIPQYDITAPGGGSLVTVMRFVAYNSVFTNSDSYGYKTLTGVSLPLYVQADVWIDQQNLDLLAFGEEDGGFILFEIGLITIGTQDALRITHNHRTGGAGDNKWKWFTWMNTNPTSPSPPLDVSDLDTKPEFTGSMWHVAGVIADSPTMKFTNDGSIYDAYSEWYDPINVNISWGLGVQAQPIHGASITQFYLYMKDIRFGTSLGASDIAHIQSVADFDTTTGVVEDSVHP